MTRFKSSPFSLVFCGCFEHIFTPWIIEIDDEQRLLRIIKRNWYLIGFDIIEYKIKGIRSVQVDNKIFGSNIIIKIFYNSIHIKGFRNKDALFIQKHILSLN